MFDHCGMFEEVALKIQGVRQFTFPDDTRASTRASVLCVHALIRSIQPLLTRTCRTDVISHGPDRTPTQASSYPPPTSTLDIH